MGSSLTPSPLAAFVTGSWQLDTGVRTVLLLSLRVAAVLAMTPVFYVIPIPTQVRAMLVLGLSLAIACALPHAALAAPMSDGGLLLAAFGELALGITLALGVLMAFAAFSVAGQLLDIQIGFGIAQVFDPANGQPVPLLASAFNMLAALVFFMLDGHHALLRGIAFSVERFPLGGHWSVADSLGLVVKQVSALFSLGFALAAPVVFCILMTELALGVVARNLPQINMLALGIPAKIVVGLAILSLWVAVMGGSMSRIYAGIFSTWDDIFRTAPAVSALRAVGGGA